MTRKKPRAYFDHKAGIAKIEGSRRKKNRINFPGSDVEFEWQADSRQSWETFIEQWEHRHVES